ncbi:MAG: MaoC/PaaZ C-terminal domain-containing protein [Micrococcaceae bacterium]
MTDEITIAADRPFHTLSQLPGLGGAYRDAVSTMARRKLTGSSTPKELPEQGVRVAGHRFTQDDVDHYSRLFAPVADGVVASVGVHIAAFPLMMHLMSQPEFPLPLLGLVHTKNRVSHLRPVRVESPVDLLVWAEKLGAHRAGTTVELHARVSDSDSGAVLWESVSTYLARGIRLVDAPVTESTRSREFLEPRKTAQWKLGPSTGRDYAAVSGDYNPIHLNPITAKALGMPSMIAHGMYLAARMLIGREPAEAGFQWEIEFKTPVVLPATVTVGFEHDAGQSQQSPQLRCTGWNARKQKPHFLGTITRG